MIKITCDRCGKDIPGAARDATVYGYGRVMQLCKECSKEWAGLKEEYETLLAQRAAEATSEVIEKADAWLNE